MWYNRRVASKKNVAGTVSYKSDWTTNNNINNFQLIQGKIENAPLFPTNQPSLFLQLTSSWEFHGDCDYAYITGKAGINAEPAISINQFCTCYSRRGSDGSLQINSCQQRTEALRPHSRYRTTNIVLDPNNYLSEVYIKPSIISYH